MSKRNLSIIGFLTVLMLLSSCASRKSYVYLNDMEFEKMYDMLPRPEAVVRSNDRLKILVTSTDFPELAAPFNIKLSKYWNFSFSISPSNENSGLISFRIDWVDLLAV